MLTTCTKRRAGGWSESQDVGEYVAIGLLELAIRRRAAREQADFLWL